MRTLVSYFPDGIFSKNAFSYIVQVNLCQKLLFLHQLTHNMTKDCGLIDAKIMASDKDLPVLCNIFPL